MSPDHADRVHASDDPLLASLGLTLLFFALCLWRIEIPGTHYFDEIHYLPAARELLAGTAYRNPEHPPLGRADIQRGVLERQQLLKGRPHLGPVQRGMHHWKRPRRLRAMTP